MVGIDLAVGVVPPVAVFVSRVRKAVLLHGRFVGSDRSGLVFLTTAGTNAFFPVDDPTGVFAGLTVLIDQLVFEFILIVFVVVHSFDDLIFDSLFIIVQVGSAVLLCISILDRRGREVGSHDGFEFVEVRDVIEILIPEGSDIKLVEVLRVHVSGIVCHTEQVLDRVGTDGTDAVECRGHHFDVRDFVAKSSCRAVRGNILFEIVDFAVALVLRNRGQNVAEQNDVCILGDLIGSYDVILVRKAVGRFAALASRFGRQSIYDVGSGICNEFTNAAEGGRLLCRAGLVVRDIFPGFDGASLLQGIGISGIDNSDGQRFRIVLLQLFDDVCFQTLDIFFNVARDDLRILITGLLGTVICLDLIDDIRQVIERLKEAVDMTHLVLDLIRIIILGNRSVSRLLRVVVGFQSSSITGRTGLNVDRSNTKKDVGLSIKRCRDRDAILGIAAGSCRAGRAAANILGKGVRTKRRGSAAVSSNISIVEIVVQIGIRVLIDV